MSEIRGDCLGYLGILAIPDLESIWFRCPQCVSSASSIKNIPVYPFEGIEKFQLVCSNNCAPVNPDPRPCLYYRQDGGFTDEEKELVETLFNMRSNPLSAADPSGVTEYVTITERVPAERFVRQYPVAIWPQAPGVAPTWVENYISETSYIDINGNRLSSTNDPPRIELEPDYPF